jgi:hypothetical protein
MASDGGIMKRSFRFRASVGAALLVGAGFASAAVPFESDVTKSIDDGIAWLDANGAFNIGSSAGDAVGLTTLALLEKRASGNPADPPQGYSGASAVDKARLRRAVRSMINSINSQGNGFYSYRDGGYMMALSLYMRTGGPDANTAAGSPELDGAPLTLVQAYNRVVDRTLANQRQGLADAGGDQPENNGYWCYTNSGCRDSSTTQLVVAGLSGALALYSTPAFADAGRLLGVQTAAARARQAYARNGVPGQAGALCGVMPGEKGHGYNAGNTNSIQQTASGTWIQLVGGANVNDGNVQAYLRWLLNRYRHTGNNTAMAGWSSSHWYYMWSFSKALEFINQSGITPSAGNVGPADFGNLAAADAPACAGREVHRDPAVDVRIPRFGAGAGGYYGAEPKRVYYDLAYNIMAWQCSNGQYGCNPDGGVNVPGAPGAWNGYSRQAYALLVLQRSTGGGCVDSDGDGVCDSDDNCPAVANPGQENTYGDARGDACEAPPVAKCDMDLDGDIDRIDIGRITALRGQTVPPADPKADADGNGFININDARACTLKCTRPNCATQ